MNSALFDWIGENWFPLFMGLAVVIIVAALLAVVVGHKVNSTARSEWCYAQGYFEVAATPTGKFICVDFRKEEDPTRFIPESVWMD